MEFGLHRTTTLAQLLKPHLWACVCTWTRVHLSVSPQCVRSEFFRVWRSCSGLTCTWLQLKHMASSRGRGWKHREIAETEQITLKSLTQSEDEKRGERVGKIRMQRKRWQDWKTKLNAGIFGKPNLSDWVCCGKLPKKYCTYAHKRMTSANTHLCHCVLQTVTKP